jgi:hypothetical protein
MMGVKSCKRLIAHYFSFAGSAARLP